MDFITILGSIWAGCYFLCHLFPAYRRKYYKDVYRNLPSEAPDGTSMNSRRNRYALMLGMAALYVFLFAVSPFWLLILIQEWVTRKIR